MTLEYEFRYSLKLLSAGPDRLKTMAALRRLRPELSLKAAKALMDAIPCVVLTNIAWEERENARRAFLWLADTELVSET